MTVAARESETALKPADVDMKANLGATVKQATGPIFNPAKLMQHLFGTVEVDPVINYDAKKMDEFVSSFANDADRKPVNPQILYKKGEADLVEGEKGMGLDRDNAPDDIAAAYLRTDTVTLPPVELDPEISDEEAQKVFDEVAIPAISAPITVKTSQSTDKLSERDIADTLSFSAEGETLAPKFNTRKLRNRLPELDKVEQPGKDATWDVSSGTPKVVPAKRGAGITDEQLESGILPVITEDGNRVATLELEPIDPSLTTKQAEALNITQKLSSFTQNFAYAPYREINIGQAARYLNGTLLKPGETFSMNETIKERTVANGYTSGTFISGGEFQEGLGGGVSTATTAMWTAAFFAGMEAVEVHPHSLYIARYQPGLEATVAWGYLDLKFKNDTPDGVLITAKAGPTYITVDMWGTKQYDNIYDVSSQRYNITRPQTIYDDDGDCGGQGPVDGFTIDVYRVFEKGGREVDREKFTHRYDPTNQIICGPRPGSQPTPTTDSGGSGDNGSDTAGTSQDTGDGQVGTESVPEGDEPEFGTESTELPREPAGES